MIQSKTVDITPMKITLPVIEMSQYDLGRQVIVHMKDGSDWFDLTGYTAKLQGTKPSGFGYTVDGVVDGHDITFASNYDMTSEAGFIPSEVRLTKNGVSLGSLNVILHVEKTPHDVTTTDGSPETIIPEMTELVERAEAAAEVLLDCSAIATTLPAGSNATASYDVDNGVFTFGIPRGNKGETGATGATGNGIASITKTGTSGLVDTYTITYTNGTTTTFTVRNGQNGTGSVADVTQNGVSVLDGTTAKVTVPTYDAVTDNEPYLFRTSGGGIDIGNREVDLLVGGTVAWNQLNNNNGSSATVAGVTFTKNSDGSWTANGTSSGYAQCPVSGRMPMTAGHKILITASGNSALTSHLWGNNAMTHMITTSTSTIHSVANGITNATFYLDVSSGKTADNISCYPQCFDLTQMFGSTIADYIYSLEQANAGAGVAWFKKYFPKPYYAYNAGTLRSVEGVSAHETVGFNQWDEEWEVGGYADATGAPWNTTDRIRSKTTDYIAVIPNMDYYFRGTSPLDVYWYDADKAYIGHNAYSGNTVHTSPNNAWYMRFATYANYGTTYNHDICINISGSRNGEYEPYELHSYPLDSDLTLRGIPKLDANNSLYYDGDVYEADGTVTRKYGIVDLGVLAWSVYGGEYPNLFFAHPSNAKGKASLICTADYAWCKNGSAIGESIYLHHIGFNQDGRLYINDTAYTDATTFKASLDGVYLVYELATPTTETAEPYTNPQVVDNSGTEEYVSTSIVPVGHQTAYPDLFSGDYNDLVNKPTIPTATSQLTNDSDFVIDASYVHTDNNFTTTLKDKLDGIASGAEVNVQSNWNETDSTADAYIANKPDIEALKVLVVTLSAFSSLPATFYETAVTADHVCIKAELGTPSAQTGDWTVTTSAGELNISGSISGSTTATLYLAIKQ